MTFVLNCFVRNVSAGADGQAVVRNSPACTTGSVIPSADSTAQNSTDLSSAVFGQGGVVAHAGIVTTKGHAAWAD